MKIEVRGPRGPNERIRLGGYQCMMYGVLLNRSCSLTEDVILNTDEVRLLVERVWDSIIK